MGPDSPRWQEVLRDRSQVLIRPVRKEDHAAERIFIETLSPQARRDRFLGQVKHPSSALIEQLTDIDYVHDVAFAAVLPGLPVDVFVGVARYSSTVQGSECECAVAVLDDWQERGLGTTLMRHLIGAARTNGINRMWSIDSAENHAMADLAAALGFDREADPDDASQVIHSLQIQ